MSRKPRIIQIGWTRGKPSRKGDRPIEFLKFRVFIVFVNFLLRLDCSPVANGNGAESFKKPSEINLFTTDKHRWDTDLHKLKEVGRLTSIAQAVQVNRPYLWRSFSDYSAPFAMQVWSPPPHHSLFGFLNPAL